MTDWSHTARVSKLEKRLDELKQQPIPELPQLDLSEVRNSAVLDLLDVSQYMSATLFGEFRLMAIVKSEQLHGGLPLEDWFHELDAAQQSQVIDYFDELLAPHDLTLTWYTHGQQYGYRFEKLFSPVASC